MTGAIKLAATAVSMALAFAPHVLARTVTSASAVTQAFVAQEAAPLDGSLTYTVALTPGDQAGLDARMLNTSLHGGEWLSEAELAKFLRPKDEHVAAVKAHLTTHGVNESDISTSKLGDALRVKSTIAAANAAWNTTLSTYAHATEGHKIVRASGGYTIPDGILHEAIQNVHPFTSFPNVRGSHPVAPARDVAVADSDAKSAKCNASAVTPQCLKHHYGAANFTPKPQKGENDVLVFGFLGQYASQKDLTKFMKKYSDYPDYSIDIINAGNSTNDPSNPGSEAMLDVCMVGGLAAPLNSQFLSFGAAGVENEPFQQAFDWILEKYDDKSRPGVITASYVDDESSYSASDAQYLCHTIQKVSALGTTVLYGSGDNGLNGVQSFENLKCKSHFNPTTPGDCPYVLSVGGTQGFPEVVVNGSSPEGFFAGAGFSNHFERPSYQNAAVSKYLKEINYAHSSYYNKTGRAYPDVAAMSLNLIVVVGGSEQLIGGTSAATPIFASFLALLNNQRKQAGKARVGWVNPAFYAHPDSLRDITKGDVGGCPQSDLTFPATKAWDLASGLGSPEFQKWSQLP